MPKGPQGQKRPADAIARAVMVAKIATGEALDTKVKVSSAIVSRAENGAASRANTLKDEERSAIAKVAAAARWKKK